MDLNPVCLAALVGLGRGWGLSWESDCALWGFLQCTVMGWVSYPHAGVLCRAKAICLHAQPQLPGTGQVCNRLGDCRRGQKDSLTGWASCLSAQVRHTDPQSR